MDEAVIWFLVEAAIFLGIALRTVLPILRKKKAMELIFEMKWLATAVTAYIASRATILILIPATLSVQIQMVIALLIAYGENGLLNEIVQWIPKAKEETLSAADRLKRQG